MVIYVKFYSFCLEMERVKCTESVLERVKGSVRAFSGECLFPGNVRQVVFEIGDVLVGKVRKSVSCFFGFDQWGVGESEYGKVIGDVLCKDVVSVGGVGSVGDDVVNKCGRVVSASCG